MVLTLDAVETVRPQGGCNVLFRPIVGRTTVVGSSAPYWGAIQDALALPGDGTFVVAGTDLIISTGVNSDWAVSPLRGVSKLTPLSIHADPRIGRWWIGTYGPGVFRSDDGGLTWDSSGAEVLQITDLATGSTPYDVWAATEFDGLRRSRDGGESWGLVPNRELCGDTDHRPVSDLGFVRSSGVLLSIWPNCDVYGSPDGGETWISQEAPQTGRKYQYWASHISPDGTVVVSTQAQDGAEIWRRQSGNSTWTRVGTKLSISSRLVFEDSRRDVWASNRMDTSREQHGLFRAQPPDTTWTLRLVTGRPTAMLETPDGSLWVSSFEGVWRSGDGGDTWVSANDGFASPAVVSLAWDPFWREVLAGAYQDGVYSLSLPSTIDRAAQPVPEAFNVSAYPNPFLGALTLEVVGTAGPLTLEVFDLLGRRVLARHGATAATHHALDTSALAPGLYLYRVTVKNETRRGVVVRSR
ncbi:MAG: photosystem II stability/assembly factor-like uncharacterized protein [Rhodothermales bacterium]|jgi:photosystem II stability/assembly factor-like uncharacterized protein